MVKLRMLSELETIIDIVLTKQPLAQLEGLVTAYEFLIRASLKDLTKERSEAQDSIVCQDVSTKVFYFSNSTKNRDVSKKSKDVQEFSLKPCV